jgi:hypothetical protein
MKYTASMKNMFLRYYQAVEAMGSKVGSWGVEIGVRISPNVLVGIILDALKSQLWVQLCHTKGTVSMEDTLLRFYQKLEVLGPKGGR